MNSKWSFSLKKFTILLIDTVIETLEVKNKKKTRSYSWNNLVISLKEKTYIKKVEKNTKHF